MNKSQSLLIQGRFQQRNLKFGFHILQLAPVAIPSDSGQVSTGGIMKGKTKKDDKWVSQSLLIQGRFQP
mgnify:CR=1 FL=1